MKVSKDQVGIALVELLLVAVAVGLIGLIGYKVYSTKNAVDESSSNAVNSQDVPASSEISAPQVNSASDLDKAEEVLDQNDPDNTNSADLNALDDASANL